MLTSPAHGPIPRFGRSDRDSVKEDLGGVIGGNGKLGVPQKGRGPKYFAEVYRLGAGLRRIGLGMPDPHGWLRREKAWSNNQTPGHGYPSGERPSE